jgi:hypothetical protein
MFNFRCYPGIYQEVLRKTTRSLEVVGLAGRYLNPRLPEHEAGMLPTETLCSVTLTLICKGGVKLSLCSTNQALLHEDVWGSGCIDPRFLDLGTRWR